MLFSALLFSNSLYGAEAFFVHQQWNRADKIAAPCVICPECGEVIIIPKERSDRKTDTFTVRRHLREVHQRTDYEDGDFEYVTFEITVIKGSIWTMLSNNTVMDSPTISGLMRLMKGKRLSIEGEATNMPLFTEYDSSQARGLRTKMDEFLDQALGSYRN